MAYTILKTNGTVLTTIADGTINTTSTPLSLPGRNYAGYGQSQDTNFVHILENFAATTPPANALRGQLWFNTNNSTLYLCPTDGETNAAAWLSLTSTASGGNTTFGNVSVTGNLSATNLSSTGNVTANAGTFSFLTVTSNTTLGNLAVSNANVTTLLVAPNITSGGTTTAGNLTGTWTINGGGSGNTAIITGGNLVIPNVASAGIKSDNYYYANGVPISFAGTYSNSNVASYLPTANVNILASQLTTNTITTGSNVTAGTITGNWSLTTGSRLNATYADLAERNHADAEYPVGTVVKVGGVNDITCVVGDDDNKVVGVVSNTHAFTMNAGAGPDKTHPAIGLLGRLPVRVVGPINKHDRIKTHANGCAVTSTSDVGFGFALETNLDESEKLVLCIITGR